MKNFFLKSLLFGIGFIAFFGINEVEAAIMYMNVDKETAIVGDTLMVDVLINSEGQSINAAEATIEFPQNILKVTELSKEGSIFNFWLEEPAFSNDEGRISFIGGSSSGFSGQSLQVLTIMFEVIGGGSGDVIFSDGAVAAADGSGTNVLNEIIGISFTIIPRSQVQPGVTPGSPTIPTTPDAPSAPTAPPPVPPPVQIERPAVPTGKLPIASEVQVPLYPDSTAWYNIVSKFSAVWELPDDVTNVATWLNKAPSSVPTISEGLFVSKSFAPLSDDIWYLHVRFRNDVGWGPTTHYRIAIDTAPPIPFEISIDTEYETDNPSPTLSYKSGDNLSGLRHYVIQVVGVEAITTNDESYKLAPLAPGNRIIFVRAVDNAGNVTEESVDIEILPIEAPVITSVSSKVFLDEDNITVTGTALPNSTVALVLQSERGGIVAEKSVGVDSLGNWAGAFDEAVRRGKYTVLAKTVDSRGAQSLWVLSPEISVVERPILTIGGVGITQAWFFIGFILLLLIAYALGLLSRIRLSKVRSRDITIAQRDIVAISNEINKEADRILKIINSTDIREGNKQVGSLAKRIKENTEKMRKYIVGHIGEIK